LRKLFFVGTETVAAMYFLLSGGDGKRLLKAFVTNIKATRDEKVCQQVFGLFNTN
jgi:hypothetical protein